MGSFRLLLAATVMLGHFVPFYPQHLPFLMYGSASVPAFYIVSGFLITLVLREKYQSRAGLFYSNRALRIFPLSWAALAIFLLVNWLVAEGHLPGLQEFRGTNALRWWQLHEAENGVIATVLLVLSNVVVFGQDVMLFIGKWPHLLSRDYFYHFFICRPRLECRHLQFRCGTRIRIYGGPHILARALPTLPALNASLSVNHRSS